MRASFPVKLTPPPPRFKRKDAKIAVNLAGIVNALDNDGLER
jgi:hypothetical protein